MGLSRRRPFTGVFASFLAEVSHLQGTSARSAEHHFRETRRGTPCAIASPDRRRRRPKPLKLKRIKNFEGSGLQPQLLKASSEIDSGDRRGTLCNLFWPDPDLPYWHPNAGFHAVLVCQSPSRYGSYAKILGDNRGNTIGRVALCFLFDDPGDPQFEPIARWLIM